MTVNDFKETACATVQPIVEDMEVEGEVVIGSYDHEENLLGRVLAGKTTLSRIKCEKLWIINIDKQTSKVFKYSGRLRVFSLLASTRGIWANRGPDRG